MLAKRPRGLALIEMMIGSAVMMMILCSVLLIYGNQFRAGGERLQAIEQEKLAQVQLEQVIEDLKRSSLGGVSVSGSGTVCGIQTFSKTNSSGRLQWNPSLVVYWTEGAELRRTELDQTALGNYGVTLSERFPSVVEAQTLEAIAQGTEDYRLLVGGVEEFRVDANDQVALALTLAEPKLEISRTVEFRL